MDLTQLSENWKKECLDIKERPKLYLLKTSAFIFFAISYYLIVAPFLASIESRIGQLGVAGMFLLIASIGLKKIIPQTILSFCNGEIIYQIDNIKDIKKINCFYIITLSCTYLFMLFARQVKEYLEFLFYVNRTNDAK